jgi:hypothetical protein
MRLSRLSDHGTTRPDTAGSAAIRCPRVAVLTLDQLVQQRRHDCRLAPERALGSLEEAHTFLQERGMLTRTEDSALPSLFGACHEPPYRPGGRGFAGWPATKYPWFWELGRMNGVVELAVHSGKSLLLSAAAAALADPLCRAELERRQSGDGDGARLLEHLREAGPSPLEDVKLELDWSAARLRSARAPLQRCGALVATSVTVPAGGDSHTHTSILSRWDQVAPSPPAAGGGLEDLVVAGVRAAAVAPEPELERWFSWPWPGPGRLADRLVEGGRLRRPAPGWIALGP